MRKNKLLRIGHKRFAHIGLALIVSMSIWSVMSLAPLASGPDKIDVVDLPGVTGAGNNVAFAFDRYILVAPYAPSNPADENADLSQLDNHYLYLIDSKKPNSEAKAKDLKTAEQPDGSSDRLYYPTRLVFDPETSIAYIRGTKYKETENGLVEIAALAIIHMNLDDNGKPEFDTTVSMIDIRGIGQDECSDAPMDFALSRDGKLLAFTNGATIFTYDVREGYINKADIVPPTEYGSDSSITYLDVDRASNTLTVLWNKKKQTGDNEFSYSSELSFYRLEDDGYLKLLTRIYPENFPAGSYLSAGSNIAIGLNGDEPENAFFVSSDGSLCEVELTSEGVNQSPRVLHTFPALAQENGLAASPRLVSYDSAKRLIGVVKQGFVTQIKRPTNGRPGRPGRGFATYTSLEEPALALAKLNKKSKVVSAGVFTAKFAREGGLSNFVSSGDNQILVATYSGRLFTIDLAENVEASSISALGQIGSRIERIEYYASKASIVAINSLESDLEGLRIKDPGSIVIAKFSESSSHALALSRASSPVAALMVNAPTPSIRRPCNIKK